MSAASQLAYANLRGARATLQRIADGLRLAGGGAAVNTAAEQVQGIVDKVAVEKYAQHMSSGALRASVQVTTSGGLVQLHRLGYSRFHAWDPFRRGMPPFILKQAATIFAAALLGIIRGNPDFVRTEAAIGLAEAEKVEAQNAEAAAKKVRKEESKAKVRELRKATAELRKTRRKAEALAMRAQKAQERAVLKSRAKFKRDTARIWRQSAEGKAARAKARAAARAAKGGAGA